MSMQMPEYKGPLNVGKKGAEKGPDVRQLPVDAPGSSNTYAPLPGKK